MHLEELFIRESISTYFSCSPKKILGIYQYGSRLYGTADKDSDWDFIVVVDGLVGEEKYLQYETTEFDIHLMTLEHYIAILKEHDIMALEMYYQKDPIMKCPVEFELNLQALRKSISSVVNNSWVKARKKIELVEEDSYIGLKSLFHALRIISFGISVAKESKIHYTVFPITLIDINKIYNQGSYELLKITYKPIFNKLMTEFRIVAPKNNC